MRVFSALIGKLRRDVKDGYETDFPFIHRTVDSDSGYLEVNVRMVYCAAFYCNANNSKNTITCSWSKFPIKKKAKRQTEEAQPALSASKNDCDPDMRKWQPWVIRELKSL